MGHDHHNEIAYGSEGRKVVITEVIEEYCESIYNLTLDEGRPAIAARLAERMGVTPVTVFDTIKRLKGDPKKHTPAFVEVDEKTKEIHLTELGENVALSLARRHRLAERLLVDVLGFKWDEAHDEACRLEHAISPRMEQVLTEYLGNPTTCPHGNPIPGSGAMLAPNSRPLDLDLTGQKVEISRITEEAEHEHGLLTYLSEYNLRPGVELLIKGGSPFNDTLTMIDKNDREITVGLKTAQKIWVTAIN